jgi:hypothetical protein
VRKTYLVLYGVAVLGFAGALGVTTVVSAKDNDRPSAEQIAFAQQVSDLMTNELVAALFTEFDETTPDNVEHGKQAISLIFNNLNRNMRLIGTFGPLLGGRNNRPSGRFERTAQERALTGQPHTAVQKENGNWVYRRSIPLSNTFHSACVLCHANFTTDFFESTNNPGQWVGALVLAIPIDSNDDRD